MTMNAWTYKQILDNAQITNYIIQFTPSYNIFTKHHHFNCQVFTSIQSISHNLQKVITIYK